MAAVTSASMLSTCMSFPMAVLMMRGVRGVYPDHGLRGVPERLHEAADDPDRRRGQPAGAGGLPLDAGGYPIDRPGCAL